MTTYILLPQILLLCYKCPRNSRAKFWITPIRDSKIRLEFEKSDDRMPVSVRGGSGNSTAPVATLTLLQTNTHVPTLTPVGPSDV